MLEVKDKKLIHELDMNARLSNRQLAKKIGLSQEATRYRINRLLEKKTIIGFVTYLNFVKLGYFGYCVYCRYSNITEDKKQEVKNCLRNNDKVYWVAEYGGKFDLSFSILAKSPLEFNNVLTSMLNKYSNSIKDMTIITKLEPHKYPRKYLSETKQAYKTEKTDTSTAKLSNTEKQVLKQLSTNARITSAEIARKIKKPLSTVIYTIKKLTKNNLIGGFTALIDPTTFGYQAFQLNIATQNMTNTRLSNLLSYCSNHQNIIFAIKVLGDWNIELIYEAENAKKMQEYIIDLRNNFSDIIKDVELVNFFEDYIKLDHYPFKT